MPFGRTTARPFPDYDQTATPSSPSAGQFWWDRNVHVLKRYDGAEWQWVGLDDLKNVDTAGKSDTNILEWDTDLDPDAWTAVVKPSGGGGSGASDAAEFTQTLTASTYNKITWDAVLVGDVGGFDLVADATVWTAPATKVYAISAGYFSATGFTGRKFGRLTLNGAPGVGTDLHMIEPEVSQSTGGAGSIFWTGSLTSGDEVALYIFPSSGFSFKGSMGVRQLT